MSGVMIVVWMGEEQNSVNLGVKGTYSWKKKRPELSCLVVIISYGVAQALMGGLVSLWR